MKLYKLTTQDGYTRYHETNETLWSKGKTVEKPAKDNPRLCTADVVHATVDLDLALLLNLNQGNISNPQPWEAKGKPVVRDYGKVGCFKLTTVKKLPVPAWYSNATKAQRVRVRFAILCARSVLSIYESRYPEDKRPSAAIEAAERWLDGRASAQELRNAADAAADAAAAASAASAAYAASADAAYAAAASAASAAYAAAAYAAAASAASAAYAASAAADASAADADAAALKSKMPPIDFGVFARQAVAAEMKE
jgi:hypothetical protein